MNNNALPYALGAILLGAVGIWFHDFALQWQPVPAGFPLRMQFASASGVLLIVGGAAILNRSTARAGALLLASAYGLWLLILHGPIVMSKPGDIGTWNGVAEIVFMIAGAVTLYAAAAGALRDKLAHGVCLAAGFSALVFGAAHFKYAHLASSESDLLGLCNRRWSPGRGIVAGERHQGVARRDAARGDDGAVRAAGARATRDCRAG